jgi:hypothetical protein
MNQIWPIVAATFLGPIFAVLISLWLQVRRQKFDQKLNVFRPLMVHRRNWLNAQWVEALNLVPVEFNDDKRVISAFVRLLDRFSSNEVDDSGNLTAAWFEKTESASIELLQAIGKNLNLDLSDIDLRTRAYNPQGWQNDETQVRAVRDSLLALLKGETALKVEIPDAARE